MTSQNQNHQIAAVIAAGGVGARFAGAKDSSAHKQCLLLRGRPLYMWCLETFLRHPRINKIVLVAHQEIIQQVKTDLRAAEQKLPGINKVEIVPGGQSRQESVFLGLKHLSAQSPNPDYVLVHDAARPFLSQALLDSTIDSVIRNNACTVAVQVSDTIKKVDGDKIVETIDRSTLYAVHTPQAAKFEWLLKAHQKAAADGVEAKDDAFILEHSNHEVKIVHGDKYNIKITVPEDLQICEAISHIVDH